MTRWQALAGDQAGASYAARVAAVAATGADMHGEADLAEHLLAEIGRPIGRVLDAGCGTGRVAIRLAERGLSVVGVDADASMLSVARDLAPLLDWRLVDLADFTSAAEEPSYDVVLLAGNVIPLLAPGTLGAVVARMAAVLAPGGRLVTGFGLDQAHLPTGCPVTPLDTVDTAFPATGLSVVDRWSTWAGDPYGPGAGYAVSVYSRSAASGPQAGSRSSRPHGEP